jgi:UDP-N-acetylmuramoyl-L-alanyl-D-glutamate--2,6-diaminopimelate ligase
MSCNPTNISARDFYSPEIPLREVLFHEYREYPEYEDNLNSPIILTNRVNLPPGRAQIISKIPANVIIDYAHNAEGFDFFLSSINDSYKKLIIIFGCGGDRDKEKRPKMLAAAIKYGAKVIFTTDNPRNEQFKDIFNDASIGNDIKDVLIIEDRKEAIIHGSRLIEDDDCLVILGKGHEVTQETNGEINFFSDYEVVNEIYK